MRGHRGIEWARARVEGRDAIARIERGRCGGVTVDRHLAARATARAVARPAPERGTARGGGGQGYVGPVRVGLRAVSGTVDSGASDAAAARARRRDLERAGLRGGGDEVRAGGSIGGHRHLAARATAGAVARPAPERGTARGG